MKFRVVQIDNNYYPEFRRPGFMGWLTGWERYVEPGYNTLPVKKRSLADAWNYIDTVSPDFKIVRKDHYRII